MNHSTVSLPFINFSEKDFNTAASQGLPRLSYISFHLLSRLLPKEISKEPFGLLTSKVRSPSHYFIKVATVDPRGRGVG